MKCIWNKKKAKTAEATSTPKEVLRKVEQETLTPAQWMETIRQEGEPVAWEGASWNHTGACEFMRAYAEYYYRNKLQGVVSLIQPPAVM